MAEQVRRYRKRLTTKSHYEASIVLYQLLNGIIPDYVDWEVKEEHIDLLKMFIIEGMTPIEISRSGKIVSKQKKPMDRDMVSLWLRRYLPNLEYEEKPNKCKRADDSAESAKFQRYKKMLPKTPCAICGATENLELDHIVSLYEGGETKVRNLQWLCRDCHQIKTRIETEKHGWNLHSPKYFKHISKQKKAG